MAASSRALSSFLSSFSSFRKSFFSLFSWLLVFLAYKGRSGEAVTPSTWRGSSEPQGPT